MVMASIASSGPRPTAVTKSEVLSASVDCCVRDDQGFKLPGSHEPTIVDEVRRDSDDNKTSAAGSNISKAKHEIVLTDQTNLLPFKRVLGKRVISRVFRRRPREKWRHGLSGGLTPAAQGVSLSGRLQAALARTRIGISSRIRGR